MLPYNFIPSSVESNTLLTRPIEPPLQQRHSNAPTSPRRVHAQLLHEPVLCHITAPETLGESCIFNPEAHRERAFFVLQLQAANKRRFCTAQSELKSYVFISSCSRSPRRRSGALFKTDLFCARMARAASELPLRVQDVHATTCPSISTTR